jgi:hypothetical protein
MHMLRVAAVVALSASSAFAQAWTDYDSKMDLFSVNFPGAPKVESFTYPSEYGAEFPARSYTVQAGPARYAVTVVDYTNAEQVHAKRTNKTEADSGSMYWQIDVRGSIAFAATKYRQREGATVTHDAWHYIDLVEGHQIQLTNADKSRTFVGIYLHESRLYILEATVPARAPQPGLFQQSLSFLDKDGKRVRYNSIYSNRLPPIR